MSDKEFVSTDNRAEQGDLLDYETNVDADKEDKAAAQSEETGQVSKGIVPPFSYPWSHADITDEVEGLKDTIGGGEVLDESEGYTRSSNKDVHPMKQEEELDAKIDAATEA